MISTSGQPCRMAGQRPYIHTTVNPPRTVGMMSSSADWNAASVGLASSTTCNVASHPAASVPNIFAQMWAMIGMATA